MSRQWQLQIQGVNRARAIAWLAERADATQRDHLVDLAEGAVVACVADLEPLQSASCLRMWGVEATCEVEMSVSREGEQGAAHLAMYKVAFDVLKQFSGDLVFAALDVGIFARRGGRVVVNPEEFALPARNALLEPPFWLADQPTHELVRHG